MSSPTAAKAGPPIKVLVVDDEAAHAEAVADSLARVGYDCTVAISGAEGMAMLARDAYEVIVTDLRMKDSTGLEVLAKSKELLPDAEVILVTGHGTVQSAVEAMQQGAFNYLLKPLDLKQLRSVVDSASRTQHLRRANAELNRRLDEKFGFEGVIGNSPQMHDVVTRLQRIAPTDATVLIQGETGTGKELIARFIHAQGERGKRPLITVNCAALPAGLVESELFGHEKGAFTGAVGRKLGRFEIANGATIFLDEVGELPLDAQAKFLRVLQQGEFERVGGAQTLKVDVRVLAATNQPLQKLVDEGKFRADLFYRLNVFPLSLPPLRERGNDLVLLVNYFAQKYRLRFRKQITSVSLSSLEGLKQYHWPGNVRELEHIIERAVLLSEGELLMIDSPLSKGTVSGPLLGDLSGQFVSLEEMERRYILRVMEAVAGNKTMAAQILKMGRKTLYRKLDRYGSE
jgi:two-component system response regulator HydG